MGTPRRIERVTETLALHHLRPSHGATETLAKLASETSRGGRLWMGITAAAAVSPRTRDAGRDGLAAWGLATAAAFGVKRVTRRRRPRLVRRLGNPTRSSSMPSSHTAGAVAYATAATLRSPLTGLVLLPVAGVVAWSRVATSRHFPTDVAVGALVGVAAGGATHLALRRAEVRLAPEPPG